MKPVRFALTVCLAMAFLSCGSVPEASDGTRPVMMLRLRPTNTESDQAWHDTYSIIRDNPGCCDEVWFSTGMGYLPQQWHADKVKRMSRAMDELDNN